MLGMVHGTVGSVQFNLALVNTPVQVVRRVQFYLPIEAVVVHKKGWGTFSSVISIKEVGSQWRTRGGRAPSTLCLHFPFSGQAQWRT